MDRGIGVAVKVLGWVWEFSQSKGAERLVLLAIADCANASGHDAWPSMTELCRKTRLSERGVQKAIRRLEEMGELRVTKNAGRGRTNRYQIVMETPNEVQGSEGQNPEPRTPRTEFAPEPGSPQTPNLVRETPNEVHPEPSEPSGEPSVPTAPTAQTLVAEWVDHCNKRPPGRVIGQIAKEIGALLAEGIAYADVRAGLAAWHSKGLHPSTLASVVHEVMNSPSSAAVPKPKPSTADQRVAQGQALKAEFAAPRNHIRGELA